MIKMLPRLVDANGHQPVTILTCLMCVVQVAEMQRQVIGPGVVSELTHPAAAAAAAQGFFSELTHPAGLYVVYRSGMGEWVDPMTWQVMLLIVA
jgi:hypothetical protein